MVVEVLKKANTNLLVESNPNSKEVHMNPHLEVWAKAVVVYRDPHL